MTIPPEIGALSLSDSYRFYRDNLKWQVYPVYPRTWKCRHPGKQPAVEQWWDYDPHDCDINSTFGSANPFNIGVAPKNGLSFVDLDSKHDKGASVRKFLAENDNKLGDAPRHLTGGGGHLAFIITNLPAWKDPKNGKPFRKVLESQVNADVKAELYYCDHNNIVLPPSVHPSGFVYGWDVFGEIRGHLLKWLFDLFGFEEPKGPEKKSRGKTAPWHTKFKGDLATLDLIKLLAELGLCAELEDAEEARYIIHCPWRDTDHSDPLDETGAKVWQSPGNWPGFNCHHTSCQAAGRGLKEVLDWAEEKSPGIVDRFCAQQRVWDKSARKHTNADGLPRVLHAEGRLESTAYEEVGDIIAPHHAWYTRGSVINRIEQIPSGFVYSPDPDTRYQVAATLVGFRELTGLQAKGSLEKYMEPGVLQGAGNGNLVFVPKSFSTDFCAGLIQSDQLKEKLPRIARILTVPLPFRLDDKLLYPKEGYDPRFATYLLPDAPKLYRMPINEARGRIESILSGFCFTNRQSKTHALARLLTPFARALIGWTTRVPLWFFSANRPRAGKDYLSGCALIIYEGSAFEDLPIGKDPEETAKRIMAAARNGRRFMHFSNCQLYLEDQYLTQALTNPVIAGRRLGSNEAASDLSIPNEMEFSISGNVGLTYREDLEPRMRKIELAFFEEDANSRTFPDKFLHRTIKNDRAGFLSAIAAIYRQWAGAGFPASTTPFSTYPEWAETLGGVMLANEYDNPCLPWKGEFCDGGDLKTLAMKTLFVLCYEAFGDAWVEKKKIYTLIIEKAETVEELQWFGDLEDAEEAKKKKTRLGILLNTFKGRILEGIQLKADESVTRTQDWKFRFTKAGAKGGSGLSTSSTFATYKEPLVTRDVKPTLPAEGVCGVHARYDNDPCKVVKVEEVTDSDGHFNIDNCGGFSDYGGSNKELDVLSGRSLALDLETCAEVKVSRRGAPKITTSQEALNPSKGEIRLVTLADGTGAVQSFDLRAGALPDEIRAGLERCPLIVHNACFDLLFLKVRLGIVSAKVFCTTTASRLLIPSRSVSHSLGETLERYLAIKLPKEHGGSDWGAFVLTDEQIAYAHDDVRHLHKLEAKLRAELELSRLEEVFELEMNLVPIVVAMEEHGFAVDRGRLETLRSTTADSAARLAKQLRDKFGLPTLNLDSPPQLLEAFKAAGVDINATDETTLSGCEDERARLIGDYRGQAKLEDAIKGLLKAVGADGRIHARFNPIGSLAGRFSSKGPNLQNVPRGPLRSCFVASSPDRRLVVADYSQIELRIGAHFAHDEIMLEAFKAKKDLHRQTAAAVLSKPSSEVTKEDRQLAKAVNFGFLYGQGPKGFQQYARTHYGIALSLEEATRLRTRFFARYRGLASWHRQARDKAARGEEEARTVLGRLLLAQGKGGDWDRFQLHTNYPVQGSAADVLKVAMIKTRAMLRVEGQLVATVHDELIFDVPLCAAEQYRTMIQDIMKQAFTEVFGPELPIEVEAKVCENWAQK